MSKQQLVCELCHKTFNQKIDFTRHKNKKAPCVSLSEIQQIVQIDKKENDKKQILKNLFKTCLNILRDNEALTGEKALRNISYLLILKLLEPRIGNEIDIDNFDYDFESEFEDDVIENNKKKLLLLVRFSNLSNEKEEDIPTQMKYLWKIILSKHPSTKNIFLNEKSFDIVIYDDAEKNILKLKNFILKILKY